MESRKRQPIASGKPTAKPSIKPPAKPSAKSPSKSPAKPSSTKPAVCPVGQILSQWLMSKANGQVFTPEQMTNTINSLIHHVRQNCSKCAWHSVYLLIGVHYFELFKARLDQFKNLVIDKECSAIDQENDLENGPENHLENWDEIKTKNCDTFSELITVNSQKKLLEYLIKTVDIWSKLLKVKERLRSDLIDQLEVFEILKSCYFIFSFYGVAKYVKHTCNIYVELAPLSGQAASKQHILFAYYCQIRFCLDYGLLEKASNYLKISSWMIKNPVDLKENPVDLGENTHLIDESYLIRIAECEYKLLCGENVEQAAVDLKELINEEHLRSSTVVSDYLRCSAYFLLTKFNAKQFPSQDLDQYFNECHRFINSLLGEWYPFLTELTPKQVNEERVNKLNINSPIWLEFAVAKFTMEFSLTYHQYATNCSIADSHFSFNILTTRLSRIYGSLLWYVCKQLFRSVCLKVSSCLFFVWIRIVD